MIRLRDGRQISGWFTDRYVGMARDLEDATSRGVLLRADDAWIDLRRSLVHKFLERIPTLAPRAGARGSRLGRGGA